LVLFRNRRIARHRKTILINKQQETQLDRHCRLRVSEPKSHLKRLKTETLLISRWQHRPTHVKMVK